MTPLRLSVVPADSGMVVGEIANTPERPRPRPTVIPGSFVVLVVDR